MAKKEKSDERKVQVGKDEEKLQPEGKAGKRTSPKPAGDKRKEKQSLADRRRNEDKVAILGKKTKPALGYQGKCVLNPTGAPRHGK